MRPASETRGLLLAMALVVVSTSPASADDGKGSFNEAKAIIADLERIVTPNGVQETFAVPIGGIDQWFSVRGRDRDNPVLLFVHGGPASPMMPVAWTFQRPWEEYFTVVQWDQRAAGKTYNANDPEKVAPTIRIERFVADTIEAMELLRKRYGKQKVILVGHSWGTIIALQAAIERPDLVHAYVGIGQVISVEDNERVSYDYALRRARDEGNAEAIRDLEALAPYPGTEPLTRERIVRQRTWAQHYGGLAAYRSDYGYYFNAPLLSPAYDMQDIAAIGKGSMLTLERVLRQWAQVDFNDVRKISFPVAMFMGRHDYTTPSEPTARWLAAVEAPAKHAVWFEDSAHLAPIEEPGKTLLNLVNLVRPYAVQP